MSSRASSSSLDNSDINQQMDNHEWLYMRDRPAKATFNGGKFQVDYTVVGRTVHLRTLKKIDSRLTISISMRIFVEQYATEEIKNNLKTNKEQDKRQKNR